MRVLKRLHSGFATDILSLSLVIIAALSSVIFVFRILGYAEYLFSSKDGPAVIIMFVVFLIPEIFKITVPIALFLASTIVAVRMSHDRELEAWMAGGVGALRINFMPLLLGIVFSVLALGSTLYLEPLSRRELQKFRYMHARRSLETIIENKLQPKTFISDLFNSSEANISLFFDSMNERTKLMSNVFLAFRDKGSVQTSVLVGSTGTLKKVLRDGVTDYMFTLYEGRFYQPQDDRAPSFAQVIQQRPERVDVTRYSPSVLGPLLSTASAFPAMDAWTVTEFSKLEISLLNMFQKNFSPGEMEAEDIRGLPPAPYIAALKELRKKPGWQKNTRFIRDFTFLYERIVVALSCLFLPVIGTCLGMIDPRRKGGVAYLGLAAIIFVFYASIMFCQQTANRALLLPEIMLILPPTLLVLITALCLRWRMAYPPSVGFFEMLKLEWRTWPRPSKGPRS